MLLCPADRAVQTSFDIVDPLNSTKRRAPRFSFGSRVTEVRKSGSDPGPAAYYPPTRTSGPSFSLGKATGRSPGAVKPPAPRTDNPRGRHTVGVLKLPALPEASG